MSTFQITQSDGKQFQVETDKSLSELRKEFSSQTDILPVGKTEVVSEIKIVDAEDAQVGDTVALADPKPKAQRKSAK